MAFRRRRYNTRRPYIKRRTTRAVRKYARRVYRRRIPRGITTQSNIPRIQKLRYCEEIGIMSNVVPGEYVFRANSLYDPNYTAVGHQPMRFDVLSQLYADYVVVGAKITVRCIGNFNQATTMIPTKVFLYLDDDPTTSLSAIGMMENGKCKYTVANEASSTKFKLVQKFSAKKHFNVTNIKDNVTRIGATCTTNPVDQAFFRLGHQAMDNTTEVTLRYLVTIDYIAIFSQPIDLAQS